ncbi:ATP-binding protein [Pectobacterium brasiliense]|uniref:HD domain-containing protein n=1 Tax=Pectobacterium brasiliense TaxID=180957 RepID=UPI001D0D676F|nr:ATP-binding protein [Pectobacterium brasiliense]UDQ76386.1 ATP-binding protein [Pectobacterium brasiliense]
MTFFPDYTDHGINHLNEVLSSAASLISDESWDLLSAHDAAAICISTLLHDCAMHISEDGFYSLINDVYPTINSKYIGEELSWKNKWLTYCNEGKRWDGKKLKSLFGDTDPIKKIPSNKNDLTKRHRLFIGEFIRREHASLAHSIALDGVPGPNETRLKLNISNSNLCDIFGFIARSHNLPLRFAVDRLEHSQKRSLLNIHVPFIMSILRIADYIQVNSTRANKQLLNIKKLVSPISRGEWEKHDSIIDINQTHEDPEALFINAEPSSPIIYKALKNLFSDIQNELDQTWSILGEIYGRYEGLKKLNINIRRIRSSLDDERKYIAEKAPSFIPNPVRFRTSDAEMMSLLISPLYGNNPAIGVRELMQNSIDACNERIDSHEKNGTHFDKDDIGVEIKLSKLDGDFSLTVVDTGIGMTIDVIENYFLNIGSSFRNSDTWKSMHETDGNSNVHRTGRFGVGLLAAFLIGPKIEVRTRHLSERKGYKFFCEQESDDICIIPIDCEIGTQLSISITEEVYNKLSLHNYEYSWDWYALEYPKVIRIENIDGDEKILDQLERTPSSGADLSGTQWRRIEHKSFDDIFWTNEPLKMSNYSTTKLVCNGIKVPIARNGFKVNITSNYFDINNNIPTIVVYDQDGRMPINLQRNDLTTTKLPFNDELIKDISNKICEEILSEISNKETTLNDDLIKWLIQPEIDLLSSSYSRNEQLPQLLYSNGKILPNSMILIEQLKPEVILFDPVSEFDGIGSWMEKSIIDNCGVYYPISMGRRTKTAKVYFLRLLLDEMRFMENLPIQGKRIIIKKIEIPLIIGPNGFPKTKWSKFSIEWQDEKWVILKIGNVPSFNFNPEEVTEHFFKINQTICVFYFLDWSREINASKDTIFTETWKDLAKGIVS